jgi:hypothetical protein
MDSVCGLVEKATYNANMLAAKATRQAAVVLQQHNKQAAKCNSNKARKATATSRASLKVIRKAK